MPVARLTILASTRMHNGICIAGVDRARSWIRPVILPELNFAKDSLSENGRVIVEPYNEVDFHIRGRLSDHPHSEDHEIDSSSSPHFVRTLNDEELLNLMNALDEHDSVEQQPNRDALVTWLTTADRSLVLTRIDRINSAYRGSGDYGRRPRRLSFRVGSRNFDMPCTDLRWRSITRGDRDIHALNSLMSAPNIFFALGLTRFYHGNYWPMVVGVHPWPRLVGEVDYERL